MRKGSANTARGMKRFLQELRGHLTHAGWTGQIVLRCDSGFWSKTVTEFCERNSWQYSITVRQNPTIRRLIVRRVCLVDAKQQALFPNWDHHAFVTNRTGPTSDEDLHHRAHAVVELAIRDLKDNGLAHCPSGQFNANAAWLTLTVLAHNSPDGPSPSEPENRR